MDEEMRKEGRVTFRLRSDELFAIDNIAKRERSKRSVVIRNLLRAALLGYTPKKSRVGK